MDPELEGVGEGSGGSESSGVIAGAPEAGSCPQPQIKRRNAGLQSSLEDLGLVCSSPQRLQLAVIGCHWLQFIGCHQTRQGAQLLSILPQGWGWGAVR